MLADTESTAKLDHVVINRIISEIHVTEAKEVTETRQVAKQIMLLDRYSFPCF